MSTVICMASAKGGSGKTILAATFAATLAQIGKRALLIDVDAATNGLSLLYLEELIKCRAELERAGETPHGAYQLRDNEIAAFVQLPTGATLLPATFDFTDTEKSDLAAFRSSLRDTISDLRDYFDYIFIDAQAGSDVFAREVISKEVSDHVIIVSEYDPLSAAGVERLKALMPQDLDFTRTWVLLNKMLPEFVDSFSEFLEVARYLRPIPWDAEVVRAYSRRRLALDFDVGNAYTTAVIGSLRPMLSDEDVSVLDEWTKSRAALIREPIDNQLEMLREELRELDLFGPSRSKWQLLLTGPIVPTLLLGVILGGGLLQASENPSGTLPVLLAIFGGVLALVMGAELLRPSVADESRLKRFQYEESLRNRVQELERLKSLDAETLISAPDVAEFRDRD